MSRAVLLTHVGVALSTRGPGGTASIQLGPVRHGMVADPIVVATTRDDVRRLVRALSALAVDLPDSGVGR